MKLNLGLVEVWLSLVNAILVVKEKHYFLLFLYP